MGLCSATSNPFPLSFQLQFPNFSSQFNNTLSPNHCKLPAPFVKKKKQLNGCQRASGKVVAYYNLKKPPYELDALEPYMSKRTVEVHWGEHHRNYVERLNKALGKDDVLYGYTLEELIKVAYRNGSPQFEFNDACQVWNHNFFWESMQPGGGGTPEMGALQQIEKDFGSYLNFREQFVLAALGTFSSGWVWLAVNSEERRLEIVTTKNAVTPIVFGYIPIIGLDMWEHAYYLDYKDDRWSYVTNFLDHLVSWDVVLLRMARAEAFVNLGEPNIPVA
ncbi:Superoxide dismutase [Fe] 3, chloroplastic [Turnera subulata]|uniref:superoxide dismutase n=1 Tax=Turnera subulata TaxID=218843 RepID=A0A9Q0FHV4_9ROSI|nr:Superoxide dismutase [Fe] 3, chloroplastic [Turnera subulata]